MFSRRSPFAAAILLAVLFGVPTAQPARSDTVLSCEVVPQLVHTYLRNHVRLRSLDDEIKRRAVDNYLDRIDPSRTLLIASEAERTKARLREAFDQLLRGHCVQLSAVQKMVIERYATMEEYVRKFVSRDDYEVDRKVTLILDPEKRGRPETIAERNALYEKLVHFQISNYIGEDLDLAEAKRRLIHRYELMTKRASEVDQEDVYAGFLDAFASSLDPHSRYLSADVLEDFQIGMSLSLEGIGVALSSRDGYAVVEKIIPGGAAEAQAVLEPKDKIIAVRQEGGDLVDIVDMALRDVVRLIRGKRGTPIHLTVLRQGEHTERFNTTIVRDKIALEEQAAKLRFEERQVGEKKLKLAILELPSFYGDSDPSKRRAATDVEAQLKKVVEGKADGLLLDLSRNAGGHLPDAVTISGFFIRDGGVVAVRTADARVRVLRDEDKSVQYAGPLVVLTSRVSASASEIVVGALKDYGRAVIVGDDHTFGKGTVQSVTTLPPGLGALKVTTALFFRPGGHSTQHEGVAADVVLPSLFGRDDYGEEHQPYSLPSETIPPFLVASSQDGEALPWKPVGPDVVGELVRRSKSRVDASAEFAEIRTNLAKAETNDGVVHLSEIVDEAGTAGSGAEEGATGPTPPEADDEKDEPSPQQLEALSVLTDLVGLTR